MPKAKQTDGEMVTEAVNDLAAAVTQAFESPNEMDSNLETANVVDGLYAVARALRAVAAAIEKRPPA